MIWCLNGGQDGMAEVRLMRGRRSLAILPRNCQIILSAYWNTLGADHILGGTSVNKAGQCSLIPGSENVEQTLPANVCFVFSRCTPSPT